MSVDISRLSLHSAQLRVLTLRHEPTNFELRICLHQVFHYGEHRDHDYSSNPSFRRPAVFKIRTCAESKA